MIEPFISGSILSNKYRYNLLNSPLQKKERRDFVFILFNSSTIPGKKIYWILILLAKMNKDELRMLRLRKFDSSNNSDDINNSISNEMTSIKLSSKQYSDILNLLWKNGPASADDIARWYQQGFEFYDDSFGLKQTKGGPCGLLAAVFAEIVFRIQSNISCTDIPKLSKNDVNKYLVDAILVILLRASSNNTIYLVSPSSPSTTLSTSSNENDFHILKYKTNNMDEIKEFILHSLLSQLSSKAGSLLFLLSLVMTRGVENIQYEDMDDSHNTLIGQFGHCSQELVNVLLTGRATSNVMDGNIALGDSGIVIKGIAQQSGCGYLTHLEALRLCQVGHNYKVPIRPIWLVGSSSHFSVLFAMDCGLNTLSLSETLLLNIQKAFKNVDKDDCGFINSNDMVTVLKDLNININDDYDISRLRQFLSFDGDIILWSTFWEHVSKLMTGSTLDSILLSSPSLSRERSDSEIAKQLQAEFDGVEYIDNNRHSKRERSSSIDNNISTITNGTQVTEDSYTMYHYNGLEKKDRISPLSSCNILITKIEAIGKPIENDTNVNNGNHLCPIDEVIKTRFPRSKILWNGPVPSID